MKNAPVIGVTLIIVLLVTSIAYMNMNDDGGDELGYSFARRAKKLARRAKEKAEAAARARSDDKRELEKQYQHASRLLNDAKQEVEKQNRIVNKIKAKARSLVRF